ncbi:MAG: hypothetical protein JXB88_13750 [Spirochaetales bacterium]|nr:hypothetical protein [Spirochaetales bacterium]
MKKRLSFIAVVVIIGVLVTFLFNCSLQDDEMKALQTGSSTDTGAEKGILKKSNFVVDWLNVYATDDTCFFYPLTKLYRNTEYILRCNVKCTRAACLRGCRVRYYLSENANTETCCDTEIGNNWIDPLGKDESETVTSRIKLTDPAGIYYIIAYADADNRIKESDEKDNERSIRITLC